MKGGLYVKEGKTVDEAFDFFIKNSDISYLTKGSYGIIFKCKLNDGVVSPYGNIRTLYKDKEVRNILIKFSLLHNGNNSFQVNSSDIANKSIIDMIKEMNNTKKSLQNENEITRINDKIKIAETKLKKLAKEKIELSSVPIDTFENEVKIQTEIFDKTKEHLDPISPSIVYSGYYNHNSSKTRMEKIEDVLLYIYKQLNKINKYDTINVCSMMYNFYKNVLKKNEKTSFGFIGMEMMDDYITLHELSKTTNIASFEHMAQLRLIELAIKTGYSHNDYHQSNILVNPNATGYYGEKKGHIILIDFGFTKKIPDDILKYMREAYGNNEFVKILDIFYNEERLSNKFPSGDGGYEFNEYPNLYGWVIPELTTKNIKEWDEYILYLKEEYDEYEKNVDKSLLKDKKFFVFEEENEDTRKRKLEGGRRTNKRKSIRNRKSIRKIKSNRKSNRKSKK